VLSVIFLLISLNAAIRPLIETMLINQARTVFNNAVNTAIQRSIGDSPAAEQFVILTESIDGEITSIQTNSAAVNSFRSTLGSQLYKELSQYSEEKIKIPIGSLTGIDILTGRGPYINLKLLQKGSITTDIINTFSSAGINQTCHTIDCTVSAEFYAIIPGFRLPITLDTKVTIAQSVIVGAVPDSYTNVNGDQNDTIGRIFDYGDPYGEDTSSE